MVFLAGFLFCCDALSAEIPRNRYLNYLPLDYPKLIRETAASREFQIFGDEHDGQFADQAPQDGIDDRRADRLRSLALRFAPYLVRNTSNFPMDFEKVQRIQNETTITVDDWDVSGPEPKLTSTQQIHLDQVPGEDDPLLINLLQSFDPEHPQNPWLKQPTVGPRSAPFSVPFIDFLGDSPDTWEREYTDPGSGGIPAKYQGCRKTYVHPLIASHNPGKGEDPGYDFVLQYWFFYPLNDAANKHKGDWEHINVVITPLNRVGRGLSEPEIHAILANDRETEPLVISRIDYYFHSYVMTLDFSAPNAYLPRHLWEVEVSRISPGKIGAGTIAHQVRELAWADSRETRINTHPVAYIGADSKGPELLLSSPGPRNRDGHGTYPFPGIYKNIGPVAAAEEIRNSFSLRKHLLSGDPLPPEVITFEQPDDIELLPDWERVLTGVRTSASMRRKWYWLLIPLRWGYPAVTSPFAGIISHAETGNIASLAPPFNVGWNRVGTAQATAAYDPDRFTGFFPLSPIDTLQNNLGWINAFAVPLTTLPPLDVIYKLGVSPAKGLVSGFQAIYFPIDNPPLRTMSLAVGATLHTMSAKAWNVLFLNERQFPELLQGINAIDPAHGGAQNVFSDAAKSPEYQIQFHLGSRFSTQNSLRHALSATGFDLSRSTGGDPLRIRGDIEMWELAGAIRYNLLTDWIQPFIKLGYGWSWYRLRNVSLNGSVLSNSTSDWSNQPHLFPFRNLFPDEWAFGGGIEIIPIRQHGELFRGLDYGFKLELTYSTQNVDANYISPTGLGLEPPAPSTNRLGISLIAVLSL